MKITFRGLALVGLAVLAFQPAVQAQYYNPYNAYYQAQLWNMQAAYSRPLVPTNPVVPSGVDPYTGQTQYSQSSPGYNITPFNDPTYSSQYNPYNPLIYGPNPGATLIGSADVMRAYGSVVTAQEQARLLNEQWRQAKLDTVKREFDLRMYIKANTPTYTQEQERIAKVTLRRIQTNSLPGEVTNGKAINYLLDDLRKYPSKKVSAETMALEEGVLTRLNVTKNTYGLGVLRDEGKVTWPTALQEMLTTKQRKALDEQIQNLVKGAAKDRLDVNILRDVRNETDKLREDLVKRVNETPTAQYLDAKRFLQEFYEATVALERGEAQIQAKFNRFVEGGRSVQEIADYLIKNGLKIGPATAADEAAYRAFHTGLASYDVVVNSAVGIDTKE
jgi:hypothetical protein